VPEAGDEIQTMKAGLLEIADIFVVNKSDRPQADQLVKNLVSMSSLKTEKIPVLKTVAHQKEGVTELLTAILAHQQHPHQIEKKIYLLAQRAWHLIQNKRMSNLKINELMLEIKTTYLNNQFNLYQLVAKYA
jgi:LAO/AO transport system kinase